LRWGTTSDIRFIRNISVKKVNIIKKLPLSQIIIVILLSACSEKEEVIEIEDKNFSSMLVIQKVEKNASSEDMTKVVRDKQKIEEIVTMVEGLRVKETDTEYMMDELKSHDSYSFNFAEGENMESGKPIPYSFIVLTDGTFFFTHTEVNFTEKTRMTVDKNKALLNEINQIVDVNF